MDRRLAGPQAAVGAHVLGQFTDTADPNRFVWIRGFRSMASRREALARFYFGPVWSAHREAANATILDSGNVLLLRPTAPVWDARLTARDHPRLPGATASFSVTVLAADGPVTPRHRDAALRHVEPEHAEGVAWLETERALNDFPGLPVREGEDVIVRLARLPDGAVRRDRDAPAELDARRSRRALASAGLKIIQQLMLRPTPGSSMQ